MGEALQRLVFWETAQGEYSKAIDYARRWLALDNLSEPAHRQLMQLYAWSGQQGTALRQFEKSVRLLEKEIGVEPEEETISLYEAIKVRRLPPPDLEFMRLAAPWIPDAGLTEEQVIAQDAGQDEKYLRSSPLDPAVQSTPFIGREKEQTQIYKLLAEDHYSRLVTVVGPGGVGKTRLALEAASAVQQAFPDGVYLVPLASLAAADQILSLIAERLHFRFHESAGQKGQLFDHLRQKKTL